MATYNLSDMSSIIFNGTELEKVVFNTTTVWELSKDDPIHSVITSLSTARRGISGESIGNYAIFAGGCTSSSGSFVGAPTYYTTATEAYNSNLTKSVITSLSVAREVAATTSIGNYALFAGGINSEKTVDVYDSSLTRTIASDITYGTYDVSGATIGNYAVIGAYDVDSYDISLTKTHLGELTSPRSNHGAASVGDYVLFAGGGDPFGSAYSSIELYSSSLTHSVSSSSLSNIREYLTATEINDYAIFAGGIDRASVRNIYSTVDAFNSSLSRTIPNSLSESKYILASASINDNAIFAGGATSGNAGSIGNSVSESVDRYDSSLTHSVLEPLDDGRSMLAGSKIGNYAIFAGGMDALRKPLSTSDSYEF